MDGAVRLEAGIVSWGAGVMEEHDGPLRPGIASFGEAC